MQLTTLSPLLGKTECGLSHPGVLGSQGVRRRIMPLIFYQGFLSANKKRHRLALGRQHETGSNCIHFLQCKRDGGGLIQLTWHPRNLCWEMSICGAQGRSLSGELGAPSSCVSGWYVLLPGFIGSLFISNFFTLGIKGNGFTVC